MEFAILFKRNVYIFLKLLYKFPWKKGTRRERSRERERERERFPRKASGTDFGTHFTWILSYSSWEMCKLFKGLLHDFPRKTMLEERERERSPRKASGNDFSTFFTWILPYFSKKCVLFEILLWEREREREISSKSFWYWFCYIFHMDLVILFIRNVHSFQKIAV